MKMNSRTERPLITPATLSDAGRLCGGVGDQVGVLA